MTNNDLLIRLRYALDIKNTDMVEMFRLGGMDFTKNEVLKILTKPKEDEFGEMDLTPTDEFTPCDYEMLEADAPHSWIDVFIEKEDAQNSLLRRHSPILEVIEVKVSFPKKKNKKT